VRKKCGGESQWISNSLSPPLPVSFWQLANQTFLDFYPNIFLKSAGTRVIEHTILGSSTGLPSSVPVVGCAFIMAVSVYQICKTKAEI